MSIHEENLKKIQEFIGSLISIQNDQAAFSLYRKVDDFLHENEDLEKENSKVYYQYRKQLFKLKFLSLSFFDNWDDISDLITHHLSLAFEMPGYDLWSHVKRNLIFISFLEERNIAKNKLRKAVVNCDSKIINSNKYKIKVPEKVLDWIKEFVVNIEDDGKIINIKKAKYLNNNDKINALEEGDKRKVISLLQFYSILGISTMEREGMEESPIIVSEDGTVFIMDKDGEELLAPYVKKIKNFRASREDNRKKYTDPTVEDEKWEKEMDVLTNRQEKISILENILEGYPEGSLEAKALTEEVNRLKNNNENT